MRALRLSTTGASIRTCPGWLDANGRPHPCGRPYRVRRKGGARRRCEACASKQAAANRRRSARRNYEKPRDLSGLALRECLKCGRRFESLSKGNRLCEPCKGSADFDSMPPVKVLSGGRGVREFERHGN